MPSGTNLIRLAVVYGFGVSLLISNVYVMGRMAAVDRRIAVVESELQATQAKVKDVRTRTEATSKVAGRSLNAIKDELQAARGLADKAVGEAKADADKRVQQLAVELAAKLTNEQRIRQELQHNVTSEFSKVAEAAKQTNSNIGEVKTEVVAVKSQVEADHVRLDHTVADLHRVKGDLGVQSGLIATNAIELAALKALNEKNYYDIQLSGKGTQRVAGVVLTLKRTDPKHLRFSMDVTAGDVKIEKKERTINEPVQFIVPKTKGPYQVRVDDLYELVINEVGKNGVVGYLSTPKIAPATTIAATSPAER